MASLKDAATLAERLQERSSELRNQLAEGEADFTKLTKLADGIGAQADDLAAAFTEMDEALGRLSGDAKAGDGREGLTDALSPRHPSKQEDGSDEVALDREDLLARAEELGISGPVGWMSNEKLQEAIEAEGGLKKAELLELAKKANIPGRSEMSKEELKEALRSHEG
jgi:hypothetical protein